MEILSLSPVSYIGFLLTMLVSTYDCLFCFLFHFIDLIYCRFPSSRYSLSAIEVSSESWLLQRCFSNDTNGNYFLCPLYIYLLASFTLWVCTCVSSGNISFEITCCVARLVEGRLNKNMQTISAPNLWRQPQEMVII